VSLAKSRPAPLPGVHHPMQLPRAALSLALGYMPSPPSGGGKNGVKIRKINRPNNAIWMMLT